MASIPQMGCGCEANKITAVMTEDRINLKSARADCAISVRMET